MDLSTVELKVSRSENLPVLPQVVSAILRMADDPNASPRMMEAIIERDPAVAAKILRVASSPQYGLGQVPSIGRAISVLGLNTMRSLVVSVAYQQVVGARSASKRFDRLGFWCHCLATATAARILAKLYMPQKTEELYGAAMMHEIGLLVMDKFYPELLDKAIKTATDRQLPLHRAMKIVCDVDQAEVGTLLAVRWGLTPMMRHAIQYQFDPLSDPEHSHTTAFIAVANVLAMNCGFLVGSDTPDEGCDESVLEIVGLPQEQADSIVGVVQAEVARAQSTFHVR